MKDRKKLLSNKTSSPRNVVGDLQLTQLLYKQEISSFNTAKSAGDSRQKLSGMTPLFNSNAFTLIELLVVVLIIGILAAVAVPQYQKAVEKSRATKGLLNLKDMTQAQKVYWMENGKFARNTSELSIPRGSCYENGGGEKYKGVYCTASGGNKVHFEWYGTDKTGAYSWGCYAATTNTFANELCKQYQASWGGSGSTVNGSHTYYRGKSQF